MQKLAERLTEYILKQGIIEEEDFDIYKYGFQTGMELLFCVITSIVIAVCMGKGFECLLLILTFFSLRGNMDGIHMKRFSSCYLLSCAVIICGLKFSEVVFLPDGVMLTIIEMILLGMVLLSEKGNGKEKEDEMIRFFSKQRKKVSIVVGITAVIFFLCNYHSGLNIIFYSEVVTITSSIVKAVKNQTMKDSYQTREI